MPRKQKKALAYEAIRVLQELADVFDQRRQQLAGAAGLSDLQWRVLEEIADEEFMPSLFAKRRSQSPAGISRTLRQLLERELVRVSIGSVDARQRDYSLTARGKRVLDSLRAEREDAIRAVWMKLSEEELARFAATGAGLAVRLRGYAGERED